MVSAYGDMDNIRTAMNRGAFDFVMKPINFEDLEITINKTLEQIVQIRNARKEHDQLASIQYDLNVAREIQTAILLKDFPAFPDKSEFDLYAAMNAAKSVGGDFYDFFMIDDDKLGLAIADVSGKGIPAALFMAVSRTMLKANALGDLTPNECLQRTNDNLCLENVNTMFVTVFYAILNIRTGELSFANAGHNAPYILRNSGEVQQMKSKGELVLGAMEGTNYSLSVETLNPGESFYLYTDGVSEAMNRDFDLYGEDRLEKLLKTSYADPPRDLIMKVVKDVNDFVDDAEQSDDITALAVKYLGA